MVIIPETGSARHYVYMWSTLNYSNSIASSVNIDKSAYAEHSFIAITNVEEGPQATMTGHNCSSGALITASWKNFGNAINNTPKPHLAAHYDCVLTIPGQSAQVHQS